MGVVQVVEEADELPPDVNPESLAAYTPEEQSGTSTPTLAEGDTPLAPLATSEYSARVARSTIHPILAEGSVPKEGVHPLFNIDQLGVDRRLIVNRKRQLKMYRVWMQGKFQKM